MGSRPKILLLAFGLCSSAFADPLAVDIGRRFLHDSQKYVLSITEPWGWSDDLALEIRARTLFLQHAPKNLSRRTRRNLEEQIEKQTDELIALEMATLGTRRPSQCRNGLTHPGLRGWRNPEDDSPWNVQMKIQVPPCTPNCYDTGMGLIALYEAARTLALSKREKAFAYFNFAEGVFQAWDTLLWNPEFHFYEKFYSRELNADTARRRTEERLVGNTNALMGLAHLAAQEAGKRLLLDPARLANHIEKADQIAAALLGEFNLPPGAPLLDPHLEFPRSWPYSRNVYWEEGWTEPSVNRVEDTAHASFTMEFIARRPEFRRYLPALAKLFLRNVVVSSRRGKGSLVCVRDRKLDGEPKRRRPWEGDWYLPDEPGVCKDGYVATSAFYQSVAMDYEREEGAEGGRRNINASGTSRRVGWGWLDLHVVEPEILDIFTDLYRMNYLQASTNEDLPSPSWYDGGNLYLLAKLYVAAQKSP